MHTMYRFSPVENPKALNQAYEHIASELEKLSTKVFHKQLNITTLKIFPHYLDEYKYLHHIVSKMGPAASFNSNTSYYAKINKSYAKHVINHLGVRIVDSYRLHVGCGDYEVDNFAEFKDMYLDKNPFVRKMKQYENMIEVWHPDFDVLGYVIPKEE